MEHHVYRVPSAYISTTSSDIYSEEGSRYRKGSAQTIDIWINWPTREQSHTYNRGSGSRRKILIYLNEEGDQIAYAKVAAY